MNYEVLVSSSAQEDLNGIIKYISISLAAPVAASNLYQKIQEAFDSLSNYPDAFALCLDEPWVLRNVRVMPVDNYKLFYHVNHETREVVVLRIFFYRQNTNLK